MGAPRSNCRLLGPRLFVDDAGRVPATETVPWNRCGGWGGVREAAVFACSWPGNPGGECLPVYLPTATERAAYAGRPIICWGCEGRTLGPLDVRTS